MNFSIKNICCIGAGYVGGPSMSMIALNNPSIKVNVVDLNIKRIDEWNDNNLDKLPIYEPGLKEIIKLCRNKNLFFKTSVEESIAEADMIFICVNTPTKTKGIGAGQASDLIWVEASARQIAKHARSNVIVIEKSTIPVKTALTIKTILNCSDAESNLNEKRFYVLSNPEFLSEGTAINDLKNPDRILIGGDDEKSIEALEDIYKTWVPKKKIIRTNLWSSELSKLTANAFLAQRVSSINSISALCESTGANVNEVAKAIGSDSRINPKFLKTGPGFGGSCFKKDILNLVYLCNFYGLQEVALYWQNVLDLNYWQTKRISKIIVNKLFGTITEKKIGILGFSFKADTNDTRESPSIKICQDLIEEGAILKIYDPKVSIYQIESDLKLKEKGNNSSKTNSWEFHQNLYDTAHESDAIIVLTEWEEFSNIDWVRISSLMRKPSWVFDTRRIIDRDKAMESGLETWIIGQG